jgi:hypothetical protein
MPATDYQLWRILTNIHIDDIITDKPVLRVDNELELW